MSNSASFATTSTTLSKELAQEIISHLSCSSSPSEKQLQAVFGVTGGGATCISSLTSTPNSSRLLLEGNVVYARRAFLEYTHLHQQHKITQNFSFSSAEAATKLSEASLVRAFDYTDYKSSLSSFCHIVGIGASSSLKSANEREGRTHRCFVRCLDLVGNEIGYNAILNPSHSRGEQEEMTSVLILFTLLTYLQNSFGSVSVNATLLEKTNQALLDGFTKLDFIENNLNAIASVKEAAESILTNNTKASILLPRNTEKMSMIPHPSLPNHVIIIPGSFNPIHKGHVTLALAAAAASTKNEIIQTNPLLLYELSVMNADKPPLSIDEVMKRTSGIHQIMHSHKETQNWGVLLTSSPLFSQKTQLLQSIKAQPHSNMTFVIGSDTLVRIIDKKYYNDSSSEMIQAIQDMKQRGVSFVVGGRLEQKKANGDEDASFITGEEEMTTLLPKALHNMFYFLSQDDFRVDLSSTQLRKEQQQKSS